MFRIAEGRYVEKQDLNQGCEQEEDIPGWRMKKNRFMKARICMVNPKS